MCDRRTEGDIQVPSFVSHGELQEAAFQSDGFCLDAADEGVKLGAGLFIVIVVNAVKADEQRGYRSQLGQELTLSGYEPAIDLGQQPAADISAGVKLLLVLHGSGDRARQYCCASAQARVRKEVCQSLVKDNFTGPGDDFGGGEALQCLAGDHVQALHFGGTHPPAADFSCSVSFIQGEGVGCSV